MAEWRLKEADKQIENWRQGYQINEDGTREKI